MVLLQRSSKEPLGIAGRRCFTARMSVLITQPTVSKVYCKYVSNLFLSVLLNIYISAVSTPHDWSWNENKFDSSCSCHKAALVAIMLLVMPPPPYGGGIKR